MTQTTTPSSRDALTAKIRALLAKTLTNGCTPAESEAALAKARTLMQDYQITQSELNQIRLERATLYQTGTKDTHNIQLRLGGAISQFTHTQSWHNPKTGINYCGLQSDTEFAQWLTVNLEHFVKSELFLFLLENDSNQTTIDSFISGACTRIAQRLRDLIPTQTSTNHQALAVIQNAAISQYMHDHGIHLKRTTKPLTKAADGFAKLAGTQAGDRATFGRPIKSTTKQISYQNP